MCAWTNHKVVQEMSCCVDHHISVCKYFVRYLCVFQCKPKLHKKSLAQMHLWWREQWLLSKKTDNCNAKFGDLRAYGVRDKNCRQKCHIWNRWPWFPIHYATFIGQWWWSGVVYSWAPHCWVFSVKINSCFWPKIDSFRDKRSLFVAISHKCVCLVFVTLINCWSVLHCTVTCMFSHCM